MIRIYNDDYNKEYDKLIYDTVKAVAKHFETKVEDLDVEISLVDENEIREINRDERDIDKVTDVLSFQNIEEIKFPIKKEDYPMDINAEDDSVMLGEIIICEKRCREQAREYGHSVRREAAFLTCHGMLHLLGYDHATEEEENEMISITETILSGMGLTRDIPYDESELSALQEENDSEDGDGEFRSGFVAIMGKPNAGKSTLINALVGEKVSIVSWKPQTTRNKILGIYNEENVQIVFIDTPGLHKPRNTLGEYMMKSAQAATEGVDCVIYVVDCEKGFDESDKTHVLSYLNSGEKVVVAVNKTDHVTKEKVFEILTELNKYTKLSAVVPISALRKRNLEPLIEEVKKLLTEHVKYYDDEQYTDKNMRFMTAEIIREKALRLLDKEVPYGIGVEVTQYEYRQSGEIIDISADIICEKAAHKPIILGKNGSMIKKIATYARQDLEDITGTKIFLTLFVKVEGDWRGSDRLMKELGYDPKDID